MQHKNSTQKLNKHKFKQEFIFFRESPSLEIFEFSLSYVSTVAALLQLQSRDRLTWRAKTAYVYTVYGGAVGFGQIGPDISGNFLVNFRKQWTSLDKIRKN